MAASKKKRTGARAAVVVVLCLVLVCVVAAAVALGLVSRRVKSFAGGASFSLDYQITSTAAEEPALYKVLAQFGGTSGRVDGQYTPEALQLELYPQASGSSQPLTRLYISKDETLYDAGQLYRTLRSSITDNYPLAGVLIPEWNMGSYISQTQLASLLGVDDTATSLQSMNDFQLDPEKDQKSAAGKCQSRLPLLPAGNRRHCRRFPRFDPGRGKERPAAGFLPRRAHPAGHPGPRHPHRAHRHRDPGSSDSDRSHLPHAGQRHCFAGAAAPDCRERGAVRAGRCFRHAERLLNLLDMQKRQTPCKASAVF